MAFRYQRLVLFLLCCITSTGLIGKKKALKPQYPLITIESFQQAKKEFDHAQPTTLFVFDIDSTLIESNDLSLQARYTQASTPADFIPATEEARNFFLAESSRFFNFINTHGQVFNTIALNEKKKLIESSIIPLLQRLKAKNIPFIALSSFSPVKLANGELLEERRFQELKKLGITFNVPAELFPLNRIDVFNNAQENSNSGVRYHKGIIACSRANKGIVLRSFIQTLIILPQKIVFFDDQFNNLDNVAIAMEGFKIRLDDGTMQKMSIPTTCYYVRNTLTPPTQPLDVAVAKKQFDHIMSVGTYKSYEVAKEMLHEEKKLAAIPLHPAFVSPQSKPVPSVPGSVETE